MNQSIPRGQLSTILLSTLLSCDKYGYEIINDIKEKTNGSLVIKQPSLYSSLSRMEKQGFISSYWRDSEIGGRRHYYSLTDLGKKQLEKLEDNFYFAQKNVSTCLNSATISSLQPSSDNPIQQNTSDVIEQDNPKILHQTSFINVISQKSEDNQKEECTNESLESQINFFEENKASVCENIPLNSSDSEKNLIFDTFDKHEYLIQEKESFASSIKNDKTILNDFSFIDKNIENSKEDIEDLSINAKTNQDEINDDGVFLTSPTPNQIKHIEELASEKDLPKSDDGIFINTPTPNQLRMENENILNLDAAQEIDNGIFITDKISYDDLPKVKKIDETNLKVENNQNLKIEKVSYDANYQDKIEKLYFSQTEGNDNIHINEGNYTYKDLQVEYSSKNIPFSTYPTVMQTALISTRENRKIDLYPINIKKFFMLFVVACIESLVCYFIFNSIIGSINNAFLYYVIPAIFLIPLVYNYVKWKGGNQKMVDEIKIAPFWLDIVIILVGTTLLYSINMLFGLTYLNIQNYSATFVLPTIMLLNLIANYILNQKLFKQIRIKQDDF